MPCPSCGSEEAPLKVNRIFEHRVTIDYYHCASLGCDFSTWEKSDFDEYPATPDVTWKAPRGATWRYMVTDDGRVFERKDGGYVQMELPIHAEKETQ